MTDIWWKRATYQQPLFCVYCKARTSITEDLEHILPEALGNKKTLYKGAVCKSCNNSLDRNVDSKFFNEVLVASGQVATKTEGKKGVRNRIGSHVEKTASGVAITGGSSGLDHEFTMSRAIAKCGVNIFTHNFGSLETRKNFPEIIQYVLQPKKGRNDVWPFAAGYTPTGLFGVTFGIETVETGGQPYPMFVFACASGVFMSAMDRSIPSGAELAHEYISQLLKEKRDEGHDFPSMTYVTR